MTAWLLLVAAIGIEVASTATLPRTQSFSDPGWTAAVVAGYAASIWLLALTSREIPVPVAYAVWAGLGTAGIAVVGSLFLHQPLDVVKGAAIALIIVGVVVLNLHGAHSLE
jgi:small multidrug resistance pump